MSPRREIDDVMAFTEWLKGHRDRDSPTGDLARDVARDKAWPTSGGRAELREHLLRASQGAQAAFVSAWEQWRSPPRSDAKETPVSKAAAGAVEALCEALHGDWRAGLLGAAALAEVIGLRAEVERYRAAHAMERSLCDREVDLERGFTAAAEEARDEAMRLLKEEQADRAAHVAAQLAASPYGPRTMDPIPEQP